MVPRAARPQRRLAGWSAPWRPAGWGPPGPGPPSHCRGHPARSPSRTVPTPPRAARRRAADPWSPRSRQRRRAPSSSSTTRRCTPAPNLRRPDRNRGAGGTRSGASTPSQRVIAWARGSCSATSRAMPWAISRAGPRVVDRHLQGGAVVAEPVAAAVADPPGHEHAARRRPRRRTCTTAGSRGPTFAAAASACSCAARTAASSLGDPERASRPPDSAPAGPRPARARHARHRRRRRRDVAVGRGA